MDNRRKLDLALRSQPLASPDSGDSASRAAAYAEAIAATDNALVVVSDMRRNSSRVYAGRFADRLGLDGYTGEDSIWERRILELIPEADREQKFLAELRFFHFVRHLPAARRSDYCLSTPLRMARPDGTLVEVDHRMYYIYDAGGNHVEQAVCVYRPERRAGAPVASIVNTVTGVAEPLTAGSVADILSGRERQVLAMVEQGLSSAEIARLLCLSRHTISRHRQEIIRKLGVRNTTEAIRVARALGGMPQ